MPLAFISVAEPAEWYHTRMCLSNATCRELVRDPLQILVQNQFFYFLILSYRGLFLEPFTMLIRNNIISHNFKYFERLIPNFQHKYYAKCGQILSKIRQCVQLIIQIFCWYSWQRMLISSTVSINSERYCSRFFCN